MVIDKENEEYDKKQAAKQKEEKHKKAKRLAEYEKLKKEFGE